MDVSSFHGTHRAIGRAFGESTRDAVRGLYARRVDNAVRQALQYGGRRVDEEDLLAVARASVDATRRYDPDGFAELEGIAEGAGLPLVKVLAMNGLTDFRDVLAWPAAPETADQCSAFIAQRDLTADGRLIAGQTWDLATDNLPYVCGVHRRPEGAPQTWVLTTVGCLSLIGMNDRAIAVGTTNVRTTDARPGVCYLTVIHRALAQADFDAAVAAIVDAPRAGGHYYWVAAGDGRAAAIECSATRADVTRVDRGGYVHTNHCLAPPNVAVEGATPSSSSLARQRRLTKLLAGRDTPLTRDGAFALLADTEGGADAICRDDIDGLNTNGAVVARPETGDIWACHGLPGRAAWVDMKTAQEATPDAR